MRSVVVAVLLQASLSFAQPLVGNVGERDATDRPIELSAEELKDYQALLREPEVLFLRKTFDRFAKGDVQGINPIALNGIQEKHTDGLRHFDAAYFKSKFMLVQIAPFLGGGRVLSVVFVDKPDRMFDCWVFKTRDSGYDLRAFTQDTTFQPREIQIIYRNFLKDPKLRL